MSENCTFGYQTGYQEFDDTAIHDPVVLAEIQRQRRRAARRRQIRRWAPVAVGITVVAVVVGWLLLT